MRDAAKTETDTRVNIIIDLSLLLSQCQCDWVSVSVTLCLCECDWVCDCHSSDCVTVTECVTAVQCHTWYRYHQYDCSGRFRGGGPRGPGVVRKFIRLRKIIRLPWLHRLYYPLCVSRRIDTWQIVYLSNKDPSPKISILCDTHSG